MLSHLDHIIFPDRCEVIHVVSLQRYVYPIFKNGRSSFLVTAQANNWPILLNQQLAKIKTIDIALRHPEQRLISGINTFVQHVIRDNPELDAGTVIWFAKQYLFLNRHYAMQFSWLLNLARYTNFNTKFCLHGMELVQEICQVDLKPDVLPVPDANKKTFGDIPNVEMYMRVDSALFKNCVGHSMTFQEILGTIKQQDPEAYEQVIGRSQRILRPIDVLS